MTDRDDTLRALAPDLAEQLARLGVATRTWSHAPVFTVAESAALRGSIPGAHTKNLLVKDKKGSLFLLTVREDRTLDLKTIHQRIGASGRVSFASAETLLALLGVTPGSVNPFAAMRDTQGQVTVVLDAEMLTHDIVNAHPMDNSGTVSIAPADLVAFLQSVDHAPLVVDFDATL